MKQLSIFLSIGFLILFAAPTCAQDEGTKTQVGGIRVGWNYSQYFNDGNPVVGTSDYSSFYAGFYRDNRIAQILRLGTGVEYYQNAAFTNDNNKRVLHYIGVPVYLKVKLGPVFALSGFEPSFKVGENYTVLGLEVDPPKKTNGFDAPFFLGAGVNIAIFTVELRYHWGTIDVFNSARSQYLQVGGAVSF
ncbi:outer membrane beta-barrel protein [Cryomorphaceae bacterium 1068]|nr:outer membrane beta-barrel protein [Cryomorphaceae bacterium 1068]